VRIYLPSTLSALRSVLARGTIDDPPLLAFAVTPALREWYAEADIEELEYAALNAAALGSVRLLSRDESPARRVVLAADVPGDAVANAPDVDRAAVLVSQPVPLTDVVSAHVDDKAATPAVGAARDAVRAADSGDDDAQFLLDEVLAHELAWYAVQELDALVAEGEQP
jgi:hypothetical protein